MITRSEQLAKIDGFRDIEYDLVDEIYAFSLAYSARSAYLPTTFPGRYATGKKSRLQQGQLHFPHPPHRSVDEG